MVRVFPQGVAVVAGLVAVEAVQLFVEVGALHRHVAGICNADVDQVGVVFNVVGADWGTLSVPPCLRGRSEASSMDSFDDAVLPFSFADRRWRVAPPRGGH